MTDCACHGSNVLFDTIFFCANNVESIFISADHVQRS